MAYSSLERPRRRSFEGGSVGATAEDVSALFGRRDSFDSVIDVATNLVAKKNHDDPDSPMFRRRRSFDRPEFALPELPTKMRQTGGLCLTGCTDNFAHRAAPKPPAPRKGPVEPDKSTPRQRESKLKSLAAGPGRTLGRLGALSAGAAAQLLNTAASANPLRHIRGNATAPQASEPDRIAAILPADTDTSSKDSAASATGSWDLNGSARVLIEDDAVTPEKQAPASYSKTAPCPPKTPSLPAPVLPSFETGTETGTEEVVIQVHSGDGPAPSLRQRLRQRAGAAIVGSASSSSAYSDTVAADTSPSARSDKSGKSEKSDKGKRRPNKVDLELDMIEVAEDTDVEFAARADRRKSPRAAAAGRAPAAAENTSGKSEDDLSPKSPRRRMGGAKPDAYGSNEVRRQVSGPSESQDSPTSPAAPSSPSSPRRGSFSKGRRSSNSKGADGKRKHYSNGSNAEADFGPMVEVEEVSDERLEAFMQEVFAEYSIARDKQLRPLMTGSALRTFMKDFISSTIAEDTNVDIDKALRKADQQYAEEIERQVDMNFFFDVSKADAKRGLTFKAFCCLLDQVLSRGASRRIARDWFSQFAGNAAAMHASVSSKPSGLIA